MSVPKLEDWEKLKRVARYLNDKRIVRTLYEYQKGYKALTVHTDTDFAVCERTRKSTSGGVVLLGRHLIKSWSTTQAVIAPSLGEAGYYGLVKRCGAGVRY